MAEPVSTAPINPWPKREPTDENAMWMAWLVRLRWVAIISQALTLASSIAVLDHPEVTLPVLWATIGLLVAANLWTTHALHSRYPVTEAHLFAELCLDLAVLTGFFIAAGGAWNPFVMLYVIHVAMASVMMRPALAIGLTVLVVLINMGLHVWHLPLHLQRHALPAPTLLSLGQTLAFTVTVASVATFVLGMGRSLRKHRQRLMEARDRAARTDRLRSVGSLAAGAAHELNTPLSTVNLRLRRVARRHQDPDTQADLQVMKAQLDRCSQVVQQLLFGAGDPSASGFERSDLTALVKKGVSLWRAGKTLEVHFTPSPVALPVNLPSIAFTQALTNLIENAREAQEEVGVTSPLQVSVGQEGAYGVVRVQDAGPGLPADDDRVGEPFFTTKAKGTGLGVFVARSVADGSGGGLRYERHNGNTTAVWSFPLQEVGA